jgi:Domain of unknown function (DUF6916)
VLESWTVETFAPLVGEAFALEVAPGSAVEARLAEATGRDLPGAPRPPFSLVFTAPVDPMLPQGSRRLEHPSLGAFELFLVPIGRDERGVHYEAVFG